MGAYQKFKNAVETFMMFVIKPKINSNHHYIIITNPKKTSGTRTAFLIMKYIILTLCSL